MRLDVIMWGRVVVVGSKGTAVGATRRGRVVVVVVGTIGSGFNALVGVIEAAVKGQAAGGVNKVSIGLHFLSFVFQATQKSRKQAPNMNRHEVLLDCLDA